MILPAVHISDGILGGWWAAAGFLAAAPLVCWSAWKVREEEVPRTALFTAVFLAASSIHVPIGPSSAHLLLNGLLGVVLGRRAVLALAVGLPLQAMLFRHGGYSTLGVNLLVMGIPAILCWLLMASLQRVDWSRHRWRRSLLAAGAIVAWSLTLAFAVVLLVARASGPLTEPGALSAALVLLHPGILAGVLVLGLAAVLLERRLEASPDFPAALLAGVLTVLATLLLHSWVLAFKGVEDWQYWAILSLIAHLPIALAEGAVLGFTVGFLARVRPQMLGWSPRPEQACPIESAS